jgi:putative SOS response-associated peptidase YedK
MLTVNADGHLVMKRFHRPEDEKRMVVILKPEDYDAWLTCSVDQAPNYFRQWMEPLEAVAAPLPPRAPKTISGKVVVPPVPPPEPPDAPELF